jgi:molybdopterin/thiamine biosynthesis adenylyltransferase
LVTAVRSAAAFGVDVLARLKDKRILIVGLKGLGVETAKNLGTCSGATS